MGLPSRGQVTPGDAVARVVDQRVHAQAARLRFGEQRLRRRAYGQVGHDGLAGDHIAQFTNQGFEPLAASPGQQLRVAARGLLAGEGGAQAGPIGMLPKRARFHWLTAKRSAIIQTSPVHMGKCGDMEAVMEHLLDRMVRIK